MQSMKLGWTVLPILDWNLALELTFYSLVGQKSNETAVHQLIDVTVGLCK